MKPATEVPEETHDSTGSLFVDFLEHTRSTAGSTCQEKTPGSESDEDKTDLSFVTASLAYERAKHESRPEANVQDLWLKGEKSQYNAFEAYVGEVRKYYGDVPDYNKTENMKDELNTVAARLNTYAAALEDATSAPTDGNRQKVDEAKHHIVVMFGDV